MIGEGTLSKAAATCRDCGKRLDQLQQMSGSPFCSEVCRMRHASLSAHEICTGCGRRLSPHQFGDRLCDNLTCRRLIEEQARERERLRIEALRSKAEGLRHREAESLGIAEPGRYLPVIVPANRRQLTPLPAHRLGLFFKTFSRRLAEASAQRHTPPPPAKLPPSLLPIVQAVSNGGCANCRGSCCQNGGCHAYQTSEALHRYLARHPDQTPGEVLADYLSYIKIETVEYSCVYHQAGGCGLPREMRSDTCNRFYCDGLAAFHEESNGRDIAGGFVAATTDERIIRAAFCDEDSLQPVSGTEDRPSEPVVEPRANPPAAANLV